MSVFDYLEFAASLRGMAAREAESGLKNVVESMELGSRAYDTVSYTHLTLPTILLV